MSEQKRRPPLDISKAAIRARTDARRARQARELEAKTKAIATERAARVKAAQARRDAIVARKPAQGSKGTSSRPKAAAKAAAKPGRKPGAKPGPKPARPARTNEASSAGAIVAVRAADGTPAALPSAQSTSTEGAKE